MKKRGRGCRSQVVAGLQPGKGAQRAFPDRVLRLHQLAGLKTPLRCCAGYGAAEVEGVGLVAEGGDAEGDVLFEGDA